MRRAAALATGWLLLVTVQSMPAGAFDVPAADPSSAMGDFYLEIIVNGLSRHQILVVRREADGALTADPQQLSDDGLRPDPAARRPDGRIDLGRLPGVSVTYDEVGQTLQVTADPAARTALRVAADGDGQAQGPETPDTQVGALLNYTLGFGGGYMASQGQFFGSDLWGTFEARAYGPFGVLSDTFTLTSDNPTVLVRGNTTWTYTDAPGMWRARAGDIVTGSLDWTRPTRLGGLQIQNDFGLRPDVVTYPVPGLSGSAALPSTAEVYVNGIQNFSGEVPDGPFRIDDLPLSSGAGDAVLVVRDAAGHEVTTHQPFFVSRQMLRPGLFDYSAEVGFARSGFDLADDHYDSRLMGSASLRYGLTDWLTVQGHAEGGSGLLNGGIGADLLLGSLGTATVAASGSSAGGQTGIEVFGAMTVALGGVTLQARAQRTFGDYNDIASYTYQPGSDSDASGAPPRALDQIALSLPLPSTPLRLNLNYTRVETAAAGQQQVLGAGFSQSLWGGAFSAAASYDLDQRSYRAVVSYSHTLGDGLRATASSNGGSTGFRPTTSVGRSMHDEVGDIGWRLAQSGTGDDLRVGAAVRTRLPAATADGSLTYSPESLVGSAQLSGAIVATGGGVALANPIHDAFALVDAGLPGVPVLKGNRIIGTTGPDGKFVVTDLRPYQGNDIGIDPTALPLDAAVTSNRAQAVPAERAGVVVSFAAPRGGSALVTFVDPGGAALPLGTRGQATPEAPEFMVGYDGQAFVLGLARTNRVTLVLPDGSSCVAQFDFQPDPGKQVAIPDIPCLPS